VLQASSHLLINHYATASTGTACWFSCRGSRWGRKMVTISGYKLKMRKIVSFEKTFERGRRRSRPNRKRKFVPDCWRGRTEGALTKDKIDRGFLQFILWMLSRSSYTSRHLIIIECSEVSRFTSVRYFYVIAAILNSMRLEMGSQLSRRRMSALRSWLFGRTRRAAMFWTRCNLLIL